MTRVETPGQFFVPLLGVVSAATFYAVLFPEHLLHVAEDILEKVKGVPGSDDDTLQDYVETKIVPCAVCGERAVVVQDGKALCAEHALFD